MDNRILELLVKKKLGTLSLSEHSELGKLAGEMEALDNFRNTLDEFWDRPLTYDGDKERKREDECLVQVNKKIVALPDGKSDVSLKTINWKKITAIAAILAVVFGFSAFYFSSIESGTEHQNTIVTRKGSKSMVILPDGSKVWINNDSKITYGKSFGKELRELTLVGEAYFDVVKDINKPFIVHTQTADVRVLGTTFNVKAYAGDANLETTLLRGSVEVDIKGEANQMIRLKPNEKVIIKTHTLVNAVGSIKTDEPKIVLMNIRKSIQDSTMVLETQWVANRLVFEQEKLSDIIAVLERWYNVRIEVQVPEAMGQKISGTFEDESIADIMKSILAVNGLKYKMQNNSITIYK